MVKLGRAKNLLGNMAQDVAVLRLAMKDPRTPWPAKAVAALVVAYAVSPIDLIPDFIPLVGQLDDLIIVPLGLYVARKLVPQPLMDEYRRQAILIEHAKLAKPRRKRLWIGVGIAAGLALLVFLGWYLGWFPAFRR